MIHRNGNGIAVSMRGIMLAAAAGWLFGIAAPAGACPEGDAAAQPAYGLHELSACKSHDCAENNLVLLYSAEQYLVYGLVYRNGSSTLIGAPPPSMARALENFWWKALRE